MLAAKLTTSHRQLIVANLAGSLPCTGSVEVKVPHHMRVIGTQGLILKRESRQANYDA